MTRPLRSSTPRVARVEWSRKPAWFGQAWRALHAEHWDARNEALMSVARHHVTNQQPGKWATSLFVHAAKDSNPVVRHTALTLLANGLGSRVARVAIENLNHPEPIVFGIAARILGCMDTPRTRQVLTDALAKADHRFKEVAGALAQSTSSQAAQTLINAYKLHLPSPSNLEVVKIAMLESAHPIVKQFIHRRLSFNDICDSQTRAALNSQPSNAPTIAHWLDASFLGGDSAVRAREIAQETLDTHFRLAQTPAFATDMHARALRVFYPHFSRTDGRLTESTRVVQAALAYAHRPAALARLERKGNVPFVLKQLRSIQPQIVK